MPQAQSAGPLIEERKKGDQRLKKMWEDEGDTT